MRPIVTMSVCLSVGREHEPYKNGLTDRNVVGDLDSDGPKEPCVSWWVARIPKEVTIFGVVPPLKCIRRVSSKRCSSTGLQSCRQGTAHHRRNPDYRIGSAAAGVTSAGAMQPFVRIL